MIQANRRNFLFSVAALLGTTLAGTKLAANHHRSVGDAPASNGPFKLTKMPYDYAALEPYVDQLTMEIHHKRHHGGQTAGLNNAIEDFPELAGMSIEEVMKNVSKFNTSVRNNGGGHFNHDLFWKVMAPAGKRGEASSALASAIDEAFGSMDAMQEAFSSAASGRFGSGWAWLIIDKDGKLAVTSTPGQDNPLMDVVEKRGTPILGIDVWEHAYYLAYQNRRGAYISQWWNTVNWNEVSRLFERGSIL